jgi:hypothetical protein
MTQEQIQAVLTGLPDVCVQQVGTLWQIRVGNHAGARADGVSLAQDLRTMYEAEHLRTPEVQVIEADPVIEQPAIEVEQEEPMPIGEMEIPEEIEIPRFLAPDPLEDVPASLLDLAEPDETPEAMQARMWSLWLELNGKLMLGLATTEETALHSRLHNELHWFAPPIEGE